MIASYIITSIIPAVMRAATTEAFVSNSPLAIDTKLLVTKDSVSVGEAFLQASSQDAVETFPERLQDFKTYWKELSDERPGYTEQFWNLRAAVRKPDGPLDTKTKELIALALSVAGTCDTCIAHHVYDALKAGATREEIEDVLGVVTLMCGGVGVAFSTHCMRAVDEFQDIMKDEQLG